MDRWVDIAEVPLVGRDLAVGVHVLFADREIELLLGEVGIDQQSDSVEGQVPRRVPRVFPLVRHGDDVTVEHVEPLAVAGGLRPPEMGLASCSSSQVSRSKK